VRLGPRENGQDPTKRKKYNGQQNKWLDYDEPHLVPNEKTQSI
jgi:hypothetical protein